ncbi:hypothetical protein [Enterobacter mori]|uniref:hypothetical protein n=1 Tax=Enterobacter mori TaxID=539813 RepID=UPI0020163240|nr:hypothetical protein [Enterobacter mori]
MKSSKIFIIFFCSTVSSCSNSDTVMAPYEKKLELNDTTTRSFHSMLYYPSGIALHSPGYIIGVEKSPIRIIGGPSEIKPLTKNNRKSMFISHIIKNDFNVINGNSATPYITSSYCFVYNSYISEELVDKSNIDLAKINGWDACKISSSIEDAKDAELRSFYKNSDVGITALKSNIKHDLKSGAYSHILIIVMGWNTSQSDAIRNFNDITGNIITASLEQQDDVKENPSSSTSNMLIPRVRVIKSFEKNNLPFRPLVIGITWPSYWSTRLDNVASYPNKANDADELGLIWLNKIINQTIPESMSESGIKLPVIAIGHSFGARAMTRALFSSPLIKNDTTVSSPVNLAVSLQGAMSINRFFPGLSEEGAPYRDYMRLSNTKLVLTASKFDSAVKFAKWTDPAGAVKSYVKACTQPVYSGIFHCMTASDTSATEEKGKFSLCNRGDTSEKCTNPLKIINESRMIDYIDTSNGITQFNSFGTGGDAHSDIYRLPMGRLLWRLIQAYAMK